MKLNRFEVVSGKCIKEISVQSRIGYSMSDTTDFYDMDEWLKKVSVRGQRFLFMIMVLYGKPKTAPKESSLWLESGYAWSSNRKFHNVNYRFCGVIHNVDRACINVLSQVIHNVNERKTVQTNMISFVSHGAGFLTIMEASAEHDCCLEAQRNARRTGTSYFVCTAFLFINL